MFRNFNEREKISLKFLCNWSSDSWKFSVLWIFMDARNVAFTLNSSEAFFHWRSTCWHGRLISSTCLIYERFNERVLNTFHPSTFLQFARGGEIVGVFQQEVVGNYAAFANASALFTEYFGMNYSSAPSTKWNLLWIIQSLTYINIHKHKLSHA